MVENRSLFARIEDILGSNLDESRSWYRVRHVLVELSLH